MKKYIQNIWVRFLACLLCVLSILGLMAGAVGTLYFAEEPEKDRVLEAGYNKIMQSYALYGVDYLHLLEEKEYLQNTNLYMTIEKLEYLSNASEEPVVTKSFSNMPEGVVATFELKNVYASSEKRYSTK